MNTFVNTRQPASKLPIGIQAFETMRGQGYAYVNQSATAGLEQIRARGYAERYRTGGRRVILVGINFDTTTRNIAGWKAELAS